jgi:hypothetical protein
MMRIKGKKSSFGVEGYYLRTTCELDKPLSMRWKPGKRPNFLDEAVKLKKHMPDTFYNVEGNMAVQNTKSNLSKSPRTLLSDEIARWNKLNMIPGPGAHSLNERLVKRRILGAFNLKSERDDTSYIGEAQYFGANSPKFHNPKFDITEKKIIAPKINPVNAAKTSPMPSFMEG